MVAKPYGKRSQKSSSFRGEAQSDNSITHRNSLDGFKVLFVSTECVPYAKTGGLADVAAALPKALRKMGLDVRIFMPRFRAIDTTDLKKVGKKLTVPVGYRKISAEILQGTTQDGTPIYFLDQPKYYDRDELYVEAGEDYSDNAERFIFFSRAALEFARSGAFVPDLFHINDWFTGLLPVYLKTLYRHDPVIGGTPIVLTIHNLAYQGLFLKEKMKYTNLPWSLFQLDKLEFYGKLNFLKGGVVFADKVTTVSPRYAQEIQTKPFGHGLDAALRQRSKDLLGIINGVDYDIWNPEQDKSLCASYNVDNLSGKKECKIELQKLNNLPTSDRPILRIISRLTDQKGFDLIVEAFDRIMELDVQFVLLGSGDQELQEKFLGFARKYPLKVGINIAFSDNLARKIEAGSDIFLMPSKFEPCGLNQLYSLKYGTVPVVRAVGGLSDTVREWDPATGEGTGFLFEDYDADQFFEAVKRAVDLYDNKKRWAQVMKNGMTADWSWNKSARLYYELFQRTARPPQVTDIPRSRNKN